MDVLRATGRALDAVLRVALPLRVAGTTGSTDGDVERRRATAGVGFWRRRCGWIFLLRRRRFFLRRILLRGLLLDRIFLAGDALGAGADVGTVVAARAIQRHGDLGTATANVLRVVAAELAVVGVVARRPVVPGAVRGADALLHPFATLAARLELLFVEIARALTLAGAVGVPGEVLANPLLDTALAARRFLLRAGALALRAHRSVICRGAGERTGDDLTVLEDAHTLLEVLTVHLEGRVEVGIAERSTKVARSHRGSPVGVPELPVNDVGREVVAGRLEHDAALAERAALEVLQFVARPEVNEWRLGIDAGRVAELGTSAVLLVGLRNRVGLARHPAVAVHAGRRFFLVLAPRLDLPERTRGARDVVQVAVFEVVLDLVRFASRVGRDRFAVVVDRAVFEPPLQDEVMHVDRAGGVTEEVVEEAGFVALRHVVLHDHVFRIRAMRIEKPVLILVQGQTGVLEARDEFVELGLRVVEERGVADDAMLRIVLARVGVDDEIRRPHLRERDGIDRNAVDLDLDVHVFTRRVAGAAAEAKRVVVIHPLADVDEHFVLAEVKDLADDARRVADDDVVACATSARGFALAAVRPRVLHDSGRDREDRVGPVVVGDIAVPALVPIVGTAGLILVEFAADVADLPLLLVGVEERGRAELAALLPILVERIGEGHVDRRRVRDLGDRRDDEDAAARDDREQDETQIHDVLLALVRGVVALPG